MEESIILGTDLAHWQRDVDYKKLATKAKFAFVKATEGYGYTDPRFKEHFEGCKEAGIPVGCYHFARISAKVWGKPVGTWSRSVTIVKDALSESDWFVKVMKEHGYDPAVDLPPVLDIEWDKRSKQFNLKAGERVAWAKAFLENVEKKTGVKPIVYTGPSYWRWPLGKTDELVEYPLWMATYPKNPGKHPPKKMMQDVWPYTFWQFTGKGSLPGHDGNIDMNYFYGTMEELLALGKSNLMPSTEEIDDSTSKPFDITEAAGKCNPKYYREVKLFNKLLMKLLKALNVK